jgi:serine/threonine-protein kinase
LEASDVAGGWTPPEWTRIDALFEEALELGADERDAFLARLREQEPTLADRVAELLGTADGLSGFLEPDPTAQAPPEEGAVDPADAPRGGRHRIVRRIGRGGMATVYLAERVDGRVQRTVAIKVLRKGVDTEDVLGRFLAERQILATLSHPAIATLIDAGETRDGRPFFVMEHVDGRPLSDPAALATLSLDARLQVFRRICEAVAHAHSHLVVHRDLKPSNVMLREDGAVKLLDFGIAKLLEPGGGGAPSERTRTGVRLFSPEYASPEQLDGSPITTATDVYQLGCLLYFLLVGRSPNREEGWRRPPGTPASPAEPLPPSRLLDARSPIGRVPADLDAIALCAVSEDPSRRYQGAGELADEIERLLSGHPVRARRATRVYRTLRFISRHRLGSAAAAVFLMAGAWHVRTLQIHADELATERDRATEEANTARQVAEFVETIFGQVNPRIERGDTLSARTLLDRASAQLPSAEEAGAEVRASVLAAVGGAYGRLGMFEQALPLYAEASQILTSRPPQDLERIHVFERLAAASQSRRMVEESRVAWGEAIEGWRARLLESDDAAARASLASALAALAFAGGADGSDEAREAAAREAIALAEGLPSPHPGPLANAQRVLAQVLERRQQPGEAEALLRAAVATLQTGVEAGDENLAPELAAVSGSLGLLLVRTGSAEDAAPYLLGAAQRFEETLGPEHPTTLAAMMNAVTSLADVGPVEVRLARANEWLERERRSEASPPDRLVQALGQVAQQLTDARRTAEALATYREALELARARSVLASPAAFGVSVSLARGLHLSGDSEGAVRTLEAALAGPTSRVAPPRLAEAHRLHADALESLGRVEEATRARGLAQRALGGV